MKPLIGISACLLGERVRYDGIHKKEPGLIEALDRYFAFVPLCPEAGAGLGVPRPPIQLAKGPQGIRAVGAEDPSLDVTASLEAFARDAVQNLPHLCGFILKANSPSCGLDVPMEGGRRGRGIFASILKEAFPHLPVADEKALKEEARLESFIHEALDFCKVKAPI